MPVACLALLLNEGSPSESLELSSGALGSGWGVLSPSSSPLGSLDSRSGGTSSGVGGVVPVAGFALVAGEVVG